MRWLTTLMLILAVLVPLPAQAATVDKPPLAPTPPMGWNSWNKFRCNIDENLIRQTANALVSSGMKDAGYEYVNIDDCWMATQRDAAGDLQADPVRFPSGIKALADYVHAKGLKLGIYSSAGTATCQGRPASLGHERADARKFAEWEVDLLKYDNCHDGGIPAIERFTAMAEALRATGRPILLSVCEWGANQPWNWAGELGHMWRTTGDIADRWGSMVAILDQQVGLEKYSGPGRWNDPDMLEVGNGGMTMTEYRSHLSLWALLNAPLIAGNDLRSMSEEVREMLTNREVIAVNQDWAGVQGHKISDSGDLEVWAKPLSDGGAAVVLFNRGAVGAEVATSAAELGLPAAPAYEVRDLWSGQETVTLGKVRASIPSHGSRMYVVRRGVPAKPVPAVATAVRTDTEGFVKPGQTFAATVSFAVDGLPAVLAAEVALTAPEGWTIRPEGRTGTPVVVPGRPFEARFAVKVPGDVRKGVFELPARATYKTVAGDGAEREEPGYGSVIVAEAPRGSQWLSDLDPVTADVGFGTMGRDRNIGGNPIRIAGVPYGKGLAPHAASEVTYYLGRGCTRFSADVGVDDGSRNRGTVTFHVLGDGREELAATGVIKGGERATSLDVDVSGVLALTLVTGIGPDNNNNDHSVWGAARIACAGPSTTVTATPTEVEIGAGGTFEVSGRLVADGTEPITDVRLAPSAPAGWTVSGQAAQAERLEPGGTLAGSWQVTVPAGADPGAVELPVAATYRAQDGSTPSDSATVKVLVRPAGVVAVKEAESGTLGGAARVSNCGACSGGKKVGNLGNGAANHLTLGALTVADEGEYRLILDYLVSGTRSVFVSVNGGPAAEVRVSGTSFAVPATTTVKVALRAGVNEIRFFNDTAFGPDLDRVMLAS
ncbi:hypothetical protein GCM10010404_50800 [Nonomuraea africana]|uniref:Alpha-galactosidase n=1 Tax=Nonomuraea africana TaxID=46171 RepID=A0ABR9KH76_9ACTN|nr:NPCBM/NEW2 domain-containing protein [Nonomuraea africana]MBE1560922.1 alpha-galactosidase [Nonomuraea africana]